MENYNEIDLLFDTRYRQYSGYQEFQTKFIWNINLNNYNTQGSIGVNQNQVDNIQIHGIEIGVFNIPFYQSIYGSDKFDKVSISIDELNNESMATDIYKSFALFSYEPRVNNTRLQLNNIFPGRPTKKIFSKPIDFIDNFSISFYVDGVFPMQFRNDRDTDILAVTNANPAVVTCSIPHNLDNNDAVYVYGFISDNSADGGIIASINYTARSGPILVTVLTSTTFELSGINTSAAVGTLDIDTIIFSKYRFSIPIKLLTKKNKNKYPF